MSQAQSIVPVNEVGNPAAESREIIPHVPPPRLPYHPRVGEVYGIDRGQWKALVEAIFPNATTVDSVVLALSYCKARKLDPFKRVVHIVPIWNRDKGCLVDTIWPGIGELRTTAFRTGDYAGRSEAVFGPNLTQKIGRVDVTFPEWCQVSVFRMVKGERREFAGPKVYWKETYATYKRDDDTPNEMWHSRPFGQVEKCAEAAALRAGFPEEIGSDYIPEEVAHPRATVAPAEIVAANGHTLASAIESLPNTNPDRTGAPANAASPATTTPSQGEAGSAPAQQPPADDKFTESLGDFAKPDPKPEPTNRPGGGKGKLGPVTNSGPRKGEPNASTVDINA